MSKPFGEGLKYMQLDVDIYDNDKVDMMRDKFGNDGFAFFILVHNRIFKDSYYWVQDDLKVSSFCRKQLKMKREEYDKMLQYAIECKIFDKELFLNNNILTSKGIQRRYLIITRKWSKVKLISEYIIEGVDVYPFQVSFYTAEGRYIGYKKKNDDEIFSEDFEARKHLSKEQLRKIEQDKAIAEYTKSLTKPPEPILEPPKKEPINGAPKIIGAAFAMDLYQDDLLSKEVLSTFGLNEISNGRQYILLGRFLTFLAKQNKVVEFSNQFKAWKKYRELIGNKYFSFGFDNFIGDPEMDFDDGKWNSENWQHRIDEYNTSNKNSKNGQAKSKVITPPKSYGF